ncbi:MAG: hypothetical protein IKK76_03120 [Alphaproteobacteria bacterium]|nr:hypothetical protein [Alphaproteobacteria bacterium]
MTEDWKYTCVTCPDNYYQPARTTITATYGNGTYIYDIPECAKCGQNAESNTDKTQCNCKPGHYWGDNENQNTNSGTNDCEPITRTVSYRATATASPTLDEQAQIYTLYIANGYVVVPNNKKDDIDITIMTIDGTITTRTWYPNLTRTGYNFDDKWTANKKLNVCNPGQCLGEIKAGNAIDTYATAALTDDDIMGDVIFTAVWKAKKFTVTYYNDDSDKPYYEQDCTYDTTCSAYVAPTPTDPTKYFAGWECTSGCGEGEPKPVYQPGNNISNVSDGNDMELTAQWETCPAGHYCTNNTVNPCPAGSTSDGGSTQITECYINENTQFCDSNGGSCFSIPDLGIIYHK